MTAHPTPQPSERTAEEILNELYEAGYDVGDGFGGNKIGNIKVASRQLFDALMEIVGEDEFQGEVHIDDGMTDIIYDIRNQLRTELRERLAVFFGQAEESGKDGGKNE